MHHADGVPHILGRYRLTGKQLGRGNYASVEEAVQLDLETHVAVKIIDTSRVQDPYALRNLHREAALLRRLKHPHIIAIFQCMRVGQLYCIITELVAGGELSAYVQRQPRGHLDERTTLLFGAQLVAALGHMHERGVVHRDLKMRNILLSKTFDSVKIVDFGLSNFWSPTKPLHTHCGSPGYAAPEIYVYNRTYGPEVDLWSLGVVFYAMAVGKLPFPTTKEKNATAHERRKRLLAQIVRGATDVHVKAMSHFSPPFRDLVQGLLTATAARRFTLQQAQEHPWLANRLRIKHINSQPYQLHSREHALILTKLAVMLNMPVASIEAHCRTDRLGEVAAMYNVLAHKQLSSYHSSWGLRRAIQKERDPSERQRYLASHNKQYLSSAPSGSQTQRCSVHTLPPWVPTGGQIPSVPRSVGISDAMKLPPPSTQISQNDSFPYNTVKSESWNDKQSSKSQRSHEDLRSIIAAQSQATEPSSQPEATTPIETNCCSTEKLDLQSIPLIGTQSKNTEDIQKESTLKEDFPLDGTLSKHTEDSQKESALTEDFKPNGEAEKNSFRGSLESINTNSRLKAKKSVKKLTAKESKTSESKKGMTKMVLDVHENEVLKDGETLEKTTQDTTSAVTFIPKTTANCQSNDIPVTSGVSHGNMTQVQSHHTSIVLTKSAMATLSSALSKTRKSVSFSLIALSEPLASNNKTTLESTEIQDNEPKNLSLSGKECSRFKSLLTVSMEGTSELQELSEHNTTELNNDTEIPSQNTESTSNQRDINEMTAVQGNIIIQEASSMETSINIKAVKVGTSVKVASTSKLKDTASHTRKLVTHNIKGGSHCQEDSALSKQSTITRQNNEAVKVGTSVKVASTSKLKDTASPTRKVVTHNIKGGSHCQEDSALSKHSVITRQNNEAVKERTSVKVASTSKLKDTASHTRKVDTHNIKGGSHCQQDSAQSKQSTITSQNNETKVEGAISPNLATTEGEISPNLDTTEREINPNLATTEGEVSPNLATTEGKISPNLATTALQARCSGPKFAAAILVKTSPILRALNPEPKKSMHEKVRLPGKSPKALYKLLKQQPKPLNLFDGYTFKNTLNSTNTVQTETEIITDDCSNATTQTKINQEEIERLTQLSIKLRSKQDEMVPNQEEVMSKQVLDSKPPLKNGKSALDVLDDPKLLKPKEQPCKECATDKHERTLKKPVTKTGAENESSNLTFKIHTRAHSRMTEREQLHYAKHQCNIHGDIKVQKGQIASSLSHRSTKPIDKDTSRNHPKTKANCSNCKPRLKARTRRKTQLSQRIMPNKYKIDMALKKAIEQSKRFPFSTMNVAWSAVRRNSVHHRTERKWL